jgi:hypothetical protein
MGEKIPDALRAGLSLRLTLIEPAFPAPDWSLQLIVRGPGAFDLTSVADGAAHRFEASAEVTGAWAPGAHWYELRALGPDDEVLAVCDGPVEIRADLHAAEAGFDGRSHARKVLAAIEAVIENRATMDQQSYQINNRQLSRTPIGDLLKLRSFYRTEAAREKAAKRGSSLLGRRVVTRF